MAVQFFPNQASCMQASERFLSPCCEVVAEETSRKFKETQTLLPPIPAQHYVSKELFHCFTDLELEISSSKGLSLTYTLPTRQISVIHREECNSVKIDLAKQTLFSAAVKTDQIQVKNSSKYSLLVNGMLVEASGSRTLQLTAFPFVTFTELSRQVFVRKHGSHLEKIPRSIPLEDIKTILNDSIEYHAHSAPCFWCTTKIFENEEALKQEIQRLQDENCKIVVEDRVKRRYIEESDSIQKNSELKYSNELTIRNLSPAFLPPSMRKIKVDMNFCFESILCGRSIRVIHQVWRSPTEKEILRQRTLFEGLYPPQKTIITNQLAYDLLIQGVTLRPREMQEFKSFSNSSIQFSPELEERISALWYKVSLKSKDLPCNNYKIQDVFGIRIRKKEYTLKRVVELFFLKNGDKILECQEDRIIFIWDSYEPCKLGKKDLRLSTGPPKRSLPRTLFLQKGLTIEGKPLFALNTIPIRKLSTNEGPFTLVKEEEEDESSEEENPILETAPLQDASSAQRESHSRREDDDQK